MTFRFNQFELDTKGFRLLHNGDPVAIEPLAFDLIAYLVQHRDRVVGRDELLDQLWSGKVVSDAALAARLKDARKALGDNGRRQAVIKTVHGRGYRFIATVTQGAQQQASSPATDQGHESGQQREVTSIAVLPFYNMSDDPQQAFLGEGIAQDITTALSKIDSLLVISSRSTAGYRGQALDLQRIGSEQGVRYLLEGNIRKSGKRVRISAQLIEAASGRHLWAERYDRELQDIFVLQDEMTREIVSALDVQLREGEQARFWSSGTTNLEAWECVRLSIDGALGADPDTKRDAQRLLEKAIDLDPDYAIAWVMLGWIHQFHSDVASGANDAERMRSALAATYDCIQKALAADPDCADAHGLLAMYQLELKAFDKAREIAERAIALAPNNAENLSIAAMVCNKTGNPQRGLELKQRSMRVCPMFRPGNLRGLGLSYYLLGRSDEAIEAFRESLAKEPGYLTAHTYLAAIHAERGEQVEAEARAREIMKQFPEFSIQAYVKGISFSDPSILARLAANLGKAGLPD